MASLVDSGNQGQQYSFGHFVCAGYPCIELSEIKSENTEVMQGAIGVGSVGCELWCHIICGNSYVEV